METTYNVTFPGRVREDARTGEVRIEHPRAWDTLFTRKIENGWLVESIGTPNRQWYCRSKPTLVPMDNSDFIDVVDETKVAKMRETIGTLRIAGGEVDRANTRRNLKKALERDPNHTTLTDYDPRNKDGIMYQAQERNRNKLDALRRKAIRDQKRRSMGITD